MRKKRIALWIAVCLIFTNCISVFAAKNVCEKESRYYEYADYLLSKISISGEIQPGTSFDIR